MGIPVIDIDLGVHPICHAQVYSYKGLSVVAGEALRSGVDLCQNEMIFHIHHIHIDLCPWSSRRDQTSQACQNRTLVVKQGCGILLPFTMAGHWFAFSWIATLIQVMHAADPCKFSDPG